MNGVVTVIFSTFVASMVIFDFIRWNPDPIMVDLGFLQLKWYGMLFVTGFALGYVFFKKEAVKHNIPLEKIDYLLFMVLGFSIVGARLAHVFFYEWDMYKDNPISIIKIWEGGLASHGGGLGMLLATFIWIKFVAKGQDFWKIMDLIAIPTPFAGAFIRIGNLWNSEIYGKTTDVPWAFIFEQRSPLPKHPTQLYEAFCYLVGSLILYLIYHKVGLSKRGLLVGAFLLVVFIPRFIIEFIKEDQANGLMAGLNMGQWLSIPFIIVGIVAVWITSRKQTV